MKLVPGGHAASLSIAKDEIEELTREVGAVFAPTTPRVGAVHRCVIAV